MAMNISAVGYICTRSNGILYPMLASAFELTEEVEEKTSEGFPSNDLGILQTTDTVIMKSNWKVKLGLQSFDEMDISRQIYNNGVGTIASIKVPQIASAVIPSTGPYTVAVTGLTLDQQVDVTLLRDQDPGKLYLTQVPSAGTPASGEYEVGANTITFHADQAGGSIVYYYEKTLTSLAGIGGTNAYAPVEEVEILAKYKTTRTGVRNIWLPRCRTISGGNFSVTADSVEREFRASVPLGLGFKVPYFDWESP